MSAFCRRCGEPWGGGYDWRCDQCGANWIYVEGEEDGPLSPTLFAEEDFALAKEVSEHVDATHDKWMEKHGYRE